jgi:DNA-binding MarR family transcriptional regulator
MSDADTPPRGSNPNVGMLVRQLQQLLRSDMIGLLEDRISLLEFTILSYVADEPGISNAMLARKCYITPQTAHRCVLALESRGLIRWQEGQPGRKLPLLITHDGEAMIEWCRVRAERLHNRMLHSFSNEERVAFNSYLARAVASLTSD